MSVQQFKKIRFCDWEFYFYLACAIVEQGFRLCGGDKGAMKTGEVCGRPLDPFARRSPCFLNFFVTSGNVDRVVILWINTRI